MLEIGRVCTAMVTPFDEKGKIDYESTTLLIEFLIKNGSDSLVVCGTTGESPTLTKVEKIQLLKHVVTVVNSRIPVIAGTGSNNTEESIQLTREAEVIGVNGVMLVVPYYNKPSQRGMYEHFKAIAESTSLPIMLYNIPGRSAVNMNVDTIVQLSKIPNVVAVKEASGDIIAMSEIIARTNDFALYSGDDGLTLPVMAIGGKGVVSVASHLAGRELQDLITAFEEGNFEKAQYLHGRLLPFVKALFATPNPTAVKYGLFLKQLIRHDVRLPLVALTEEERRHVEQELESFFVK